MYVKAIATFDSKQLGQHIRAGMTFHCAPGYAKDLQRNHLVEILSTADSEPAPSSNKAIPGAPATSGKEPAPPQPGESAPPQTDGQDQPSASSQAAPVSRRRTVLTSSIGGRKKKSDEESSP